MTHLSIFTAFVSGLIWSFQIHKQQTAAQPDSTVQEQQEQYTDTKDNEKKGQELRKGSPKDSKRLAEGKIR